MKLSGDFFRQVSFDGQRYVIELNAGHCIYGAHFPGHPVTPGVCLVQMVQELLSHTMECRLYTRSIRNVKFVSIVSPLTDARIAVTVTKLEQENGQINVQARIEGADDSSRQFAKMSLVLEKEAF